ncbi:hypothetical protein CSA56_06250 [candidate division KSB3 bacterium]|uniref:Glycosyltransferase subfamily 4-like N-terminal domain-containing protein n=1 Tax=candidate division KSB3 bacterium TaxID=2044937 RepID=A0A2G6KH02_9BACT|nr:MAG: hypothetical protein CSA56_06250 [candidate division KSB3 bacterium]
MDSPKILYIHHGSVPGGAPTSLRNLLRGLRTQAGFRLKVLCIYDSMIPFFREVEGVDVGSYCQTSVIAGRIFIGWSRGWSLRRLKLFLKELRAVPGFIQREMAILQAEQPDIVHLNSAILWTTAIAAKRCGIPLVWHIREVSTFGKHHLLRLVYTWFIRKIADAVICIGPEEYEKIEGWRSDKIILIRNSLDESYLSDPEPDTREQTREQLGITPESFCLLSLGGNSFRKGAYQILEVIKFFPQVDITLVMAGIPPQPYTDKISLTKRVALRLENFMVKLGMKSYYSWYYPERLAQSLQRSDSMKIRCPGIVDDVKPLIHACDVLLFADTTSHSGRPVYEAWALKKPVIAFDSKAMRHDIEDGIDGLLVKEKTSEALASAIRYAQEHPPELQQMGEAGYCKTVERFSLRQNTQKVCDIYQTLLCG